jgi:sodium/bile acid cotransporter 7
MVAMTTFVLFPLVGAGLMALFPRLLPQSLWLGVLFVCALPTTVQSSIALTSIARGNVAGAICAATASNLAGVILTPLIFGAISPAHGGGIALGSIGQVLLQLLVPFVGGHLARPWIGAWAAQHRRLLAVTDRGSILLVVYASFSAAVVKGVWHQLPPVTLLTAGAIVVTLLGTVLVALIVTSRTLGFSAPDEVAAAFCGSQKSLVTAVPMANALFSGATVGLTLIPIMLYYPAQLLLGAWLARRYAAGVPVLSGGGKLDAIARCANGLAEAACAPTTLGAPARR